MCHFPVAICNLRMIYGIQVFIFFVPQYMCQEWGKEVEDGKSASGKSCKVLVTLENNTDWCDEQKVRSGLSNPTCLKIYVTTGMLAMQTQF